MSVVANVGINLDARAALQQLRAFYQQSQSAGQAAQQLQASTDKLQSAFTKQRGSTAELAKRLRELKTEYERLTASAKESARAGGEGFSAATVGKLRKLSSEINSTREAFLNSKAAAANYKAELDKVANSSQEVDKASKGVSGSIGRVGGVIASIGAGALVAGMVRGAAAAEQLQLRLRVLSAEYGETARVQQFVSDSAKTFGQSQTEAAAGVADVYARLRPLGITLDQIETVYKGFNATALASGTSAEAASGAFLQLSQALGSGRLQGDEFSSVAEQVPGILRLVAGEMGVTVGELKKLGSEGKITSDILINALAKGFDENSSKIKALLDQSPAQRFKEFKDSTQALSNALGSELLPAIVPIVKQATELLRLFGSLPGPVKTLAAAVLGVTAAFVALAPAISTVIGLLGPAGIAGLIAAGPWIALAAGIGAATVALAGYRTESQKLSQSVGAAARTGNAADLTVAERRALVLEKQISEAERAQSGSGTTTNARTGQGARRGAATNAAATAGGRAGAAGGGGRGGGQRSAAGTSLASKRAELAQLQRDIAQGRQAASVATPTVPTGATAPTGAGAAAGGGRKGGKSEAEKAAEAAKRQAEELKRSYELGTQLGTQYQRQLLLLDAGTEQERRRLQIQFDFEDREKQISELKSKTQQANLRDLSNEQKRLELRQLDLEYLREQLSIFERIAGLDFSKTADLGKRAFAGGAGTFDPSLPDLRVSPAEQQMAKYREELAALTDPINMAVTGADAIGNAFGQAFQDIATGAKSTQEALADVFKGIGEAFIQMATQIIAKQLAMIAFQGILKALGGASSFGFSGSGPAALPSGDGFAAGFSMPSLLPGRAMGGPVSSRTPYIVGERGPELFVPGASGSIISSDATRAALADNRGFLDSLSSALDPQSEDDSTTGDATAATRASVRETERLRENRLQLMNQQSASERRYEREQIERMMAAPSRLDIKYESQVINNVEYVTRDQAERMAAQSAIRGRELALSSLQNSVKARKRVGMA